MSFIEVLNLAFNPAALIMDFDGVLTDNKVIVFEDGREAVSCNRSDGLGIGILRQAGIKLLILSTEKNPVVQKRAEKLNVECLSGITNKLEALKNWAQGKELKLEDLVYVGNDTNDLECLKAIGFPVIEADAHPALFDHAKLVLNKRGGEGAIRELTDIICSQEGE